jgi:hypothetical protein
VSEPDDVSWFVVVCFAQRCLSQDERYCLLCAFAKAFPHVLRFVLSCSVHLKITKRKFWRLALFTIFLM